VKRLLTALIVALPLSLVVLPAAAQEAPSYAQAQNAAEDDAQIRGRITAFDGGYNVQVTDEKGYADNVELHEGTIINPTGLTLEPGMVVSVLGYNAGSYFAANEIDTPYMQQGGDPYYAGHPWNYYGPSVDLGFFFGSTGWWHGDGFQGQNEFRGGTRVYSGARAGGSGVRGTYNGGTFQGRAYVAPPERGGYHASATSRGSGGSHAAAESHGERH
jgi:hypothetical protein